MFVWFPELSGKVDDAIQELMNWQHVRTGKRNWCSAGKGSCAFHGRHQLTALGVLESLTPLA